MLYIGHFSFFGPDDPENPANGFFNCVAEAASPEEAIDKFGELLERLKETDDVFDGVEAVFMDECTEVKSIPEGGFLDHWTAVTPVPVSTVTTSLRGIEQDQAAVYYMGSDEDTAEGEEDEATEPFLCWTEEAESE